MDLEKKPWIPIGYKKPNIQLNVWYKKIHEISRTDRLENMIAIMEGMSADHMKVGAVLKNRQEVAQFIEMMEHALDSFDKK